MVQHDIKRVLAYSTISQLGYMFLACGVAAYSAAIFHVVTHAFFKALLFLAAGSVIHALSGEQDMRLMGGLRKRIPITFWTMTAGVFAIAGIPPFAGFFSKDKILYQAFASPSPVGKLVWAIGLLTAGITSFYMFRLWFKTFFGPLRFNERHADQTTNASEHDDAQTQQHHGIHESPWIMLLPLAILALLSLTGGWIGIPAVFHGANHFEHFLDPVFATNAFSAPIFAAGPALNADNESHSLEFLLALVSVATAFLGLFVAWFFYYKRPGTAAALAARAKPLYTFVTNKFYVDELYHAIFVTGLLGFTRAFLSGVGEFAVNGFGTLATWTAVDLGEATRRIQSGNLRSYAGWLAAGAAVVMAVMLFGRGLFFHHAPF